MRMPSTAPVVVVGGGHNGLVAGCYLARAGRFNTCPSAPFDVEGGWDAQAEAFADAMVEQVEQHAPGFTASIRERGPHARVDGRRVALAGRAPDVPGHQP